MMTDINKEQNSFNSFDCFKSLEKKDFDFQKYKSKQLEYLSGETLFKQGAFAPYILYIINGLVKIYLQTGPDKQMNIRIAKTGEFLAFSTIFGDDIYNYSAVALKNSNICMIEKESMKQVLIENPDFALMITSKNYKHEKHLLDIIKNISHKQMRGKLASSLLYLSQNEFKEHNIFTLLKRQDIADFASISTESTIKFLKEFETESIIKLQGKNIEILQNDKLNDIARRG